MVCLSLMTVFMRATEYEIASLPTVARNDGERGSTRNDKEQMRYAQRNRQHEKLLTSLPL